MKEKMFCGFIGVIGGIITQLYGGWSDAMTTLLIFMAIDYVTGLMVAACGKSPKSANGGLSSKAGFHGLFKKFIIMLLIIVAYRLDLLIGTNYIRDAACIAFILNETISLIENASYFVPKMPGVFQKAIDILRSKSEDDEDSGESENVQK
ncbi:MAG: phage holin family protein [Oscillospiraceae bacterium]|nr:phage holin family protein [Oscillospiraceae bacterium]